MNTVIHIGYRNGSLGHSTHCGLDVEELPEQDTWTLDRYAADCETCLRNEARDTEAA